MKMRHITSVLLASVAIFAFTSSAQADDLTRGFAGVKSGSVNIAPFGPLEIEPDPSTGQINGSFNLQKPGKGHNGGSVEAIVNLNSNLVTFESGTATVGKNTLSTSISGIDIIACARRPSSFRSHCT